MVKSFDAFVPENGLLQQIQRPLDQSDFRYPQSEIPLKSIDTQFSQRSQPQQRPKDRSDSRNSKATSMSTGKASEWARTQSAVTFENIVRQLVQQEGEAKEGRRLLRIAVEKLGTLQDRANAAEEARKGETARGVRIAQTALGVQEQANRARYDAELYRLELERKEREIKHQQELMRVIEAERDLAEKEAAKAREVARQLNDERLISLAHREGRKMGLIEGMQHGRRFAVIQRIQPSSSAFIEDFDDEDPQPRQIRGVQPSIPPAEVARRKREAAEAARKEQEAAAAEAARKQLEAAEAVRKQLEAAEAVRKQFEAAEVLRREIEAAKRTAEEQVHREAQEREYKRQQEALQAERQREAIRAAEREIEQQRVREREAELEREKEALRRQEAARALEMEAMRRREQEKERELEAERERERQLEEERNNERRQREEREAELAREREKVRELEVERERERELSSNSSVSHRSQPKQRLGYLAMPEPPPFKTPRPGSKPPTPSGTTSPLPLRVLPPNFRPPQQFQPNPRARPHPRRASQSSQETSFSGSGSTSLRNLDIVTFPNPPRRVASHLSDIPEVASHSGMSEAGKSPVPSVGQGNGHSPVQVVNLRPERARRMEDVERWVQSTAASEATPTEPNTPPHTSGTNPSMYGNHDAGSFSSGTIVIEVEPPSRPTSFISPTREDGMFLSPNSQPLQLAPDPRTQPQPQEHQHQPPQSPYQHGGLLESEQPGFQPVIPDGLDGDDDIQHLMNFGTPNGFVPIAITRTNTSEGSSRSTGESERRERRTGGPGGGLGSRIYGPPASSSSGARSYGPTQTQTPRTQIYATPGLPASTSAQQISQTPRQTPRQIYSAMPASSSGSLSGSGSNIYAQAQPPSRAPKRTSIYAPTSPSVTAPVIPSVVHSSPRPPSIYGPPASPRTAHNIPPVIPPPPSQSSSSLQIPAPVSDRNRPVIPSTPRQIYSPNTTGPVLPSSSANGYPYPVSPGSRVGGLPGIGGATPRSHNTPLGAGVGMRTPGGSMAPLPSSASVGWAAAAATPGSRTSALPRGSATPRVRSMTLDVDDEDEEDDHDLVTRLNTEANRSGRGVTLKRLPSLK